MKKTKNNKNKIEEEIEMEEEKIEETEEMSPEDLEKLKEGVLQTLEKAKEDVLEDLETEKQLSEYNKIGGVEKEEYPLFLTVKKLVYMLDGD